MMQQRLTNAEFHMVKMDLRAEIANDINLQRLRRRQTGNKLQHSSYLLLAS